MKLKEVNQKHHATREHERDLTKVLNRYVIGPIQGHNDIGILQQLFSLFFFNLKHIGFEGTLRTPDTITRWIQMSNDGFKLVNHLDVCENGCYLFPEDNKNVLFCPIAECSRPRYSKNDQAAALVNAGFDLNNESAVLFEPVQRLSVVSVGAALAQMLIDEGKRSLFDYRASMEPLVEGERVYRDVFDGEVFQSWIDQGNIFQNSNDIALLIFVDGFEPKYVNNHTMTIVHCLIMSIDPSYR